MLTAPKLKTLQELLAGASKEELIWLSGYLAGVVAQNPAIAGLAAPPALTAAPETGIAAAKPAVGKITIAYGTETGNSKRLASTFAAKAKKSGINAKLVGLETYKLTDLPKEEYLLAVISTQGDGEPPAAAKKFYDHLYSGGLRLEKLKYSVLALGDTSYPLFCKAGEDVDSQLQSVGAQRILHLQKCDTDYQADAESWFEEVLSLLTTSDAPAAPAPAAAPVRKPAGKKIYAGEISTNVNLNDTGSDKQTHHIEITADDIDYQPGDSIGIIPENPLATVEAIISLTGIDPVRTIGWREEQISIHNLLKKKLNLVFLPDRVVRKYASIVRQEIPETRIGLLDLLKIYPVKDTNQFLEVLAILEPIAPRLYSISSSPEAHSGEIHVTVARDRFVVNDEVKHGLCSDMLCHLAPGSQLEFYISRNSEFKLPASDKDIILIGPGTGIAPFRSFLAERDALAASGRNWLFFGDQHFTTDFLYQTEIQNWVETGVLTRVNTAFSRDQKEKVYVQHRMLKQGADLFEWLESGASVFICGAKTPMSEDVETALLNIIQQHGKKTAGQAIGYLDELKEAGRFVKDVY